MGTKPAETYLLWWVFSMHEIGPATRFSRDSSFQKFIAHRLELTAFVLLGKILQDANTVESYKIEEKGFIVCMVQKVQLLNHIVKVHHLTFKQPKTAPASTSTASSSAQPPSTPAQATTSTPAAPPAAPAAAANPTSETTPVTPTPAFTGSTATTAGTGSFNDPSALALGTERASAIANLESMGFERSQIDRAMRAAFNNPDRAVEYLLNVRFTIGESCT